MLMTKGLMDRAVRNELTLERVRDQAKVTEEELLQLQNWKVVTEKKLKLAEEARDEHQRTVEELKAVRGRWRNSSPIWSSGYAYDEGSNGPSSAQ